MTDRPDVPSRAVLTAFGAGGAVVTPLPGGEETSVRAGPLVLKRVQDLAAARWTQQLVADTGDFGASVGLRLPRPIRTVAGTWHADGWVGSEFVDDLVPLAGDPARIVDVGERLARVLTEAWSDDGAPIRQRADRWAAADRHVWGEHPVGLPEDAGEVAGRLGERIGAPAGPVAVIHGDLSGNVFADRTGTPVVLDMTPYLRPVRYGSAIVVGDNLLWRDGSLGLVALIDGDEDALARALLFRLVSEQLAAAPRHGAVLDDYRTVLTALGW